MKKFLFLFLFSLFILIPINSYATPSIPTDLPLYQYSFTYQNEGIYYLHTSQLPFHFVSGDTFSSISPTSIKRYAFSNDSWLLTLDTSVQNAYFPTNMQSKITSSNYDILETSDQSVFFSPRIIPRQVEEIPQRMVQDGLTVLSVALPAFGILLAVSLIPRLVTRFLY